MAEETSWTPTAGIGHLCSVHTCAAFSQVVRELPNLKQVYWRRREVCPRLFDAWLSDANEGDGKSARSLERVVVDLSMPDMQQMKDGAYAAQARECACGCWCGACVKRAKKMCSKNGSEDDETEEETLLSKMVRAGTMAAREMPKVKEMLVVGYKCPEKELDNDAKRAVVVDCLTGTKRLLEVG